MVADDQTDRASITVMIEATVAPPNNPPVFSDGASTTRSVRAGAPAGASIGLPVTATDADQGDTLTYSLEGQDAASFNINTTTGQLLTISGVTLTAGEIYTVTVAASDTKTRATYYGNNRGHHGSAQRRARILSSHELPRAAWTRTRRQGPNIGIPRLRNRPQ